MTPVAHQAVRRITKRGVCVGLVLASLLLAAPVAASAHIDAQQTEAPTYELGGTVCQDASYYDLTTSVTANFPFAINGASNNEWVAWTAVLWKYDGVWRKIDESKPWVWVQTPFLKTGYGFDVQHRGYTFDRDPLGATGDARLEPGYYAVVNWFYSYSTKEFYSDNTSPGCYIRPWSS